MAASQGAHGTGAERNPLRKVLFMLSVGLCMLCVYFCLDYQSGSGAQMSGELIVGKVDSAGYGNTDSSVTGFFFEHFGVLSYLFCFAIVYLGYFILLKPVDIWRADFFKGGLRILGFNCVLLGAAGILSRFADIGPTGAGGLLGDMLNIFFDLFVPNILTVLTFGMVMVCGIAFMSGSTPFALFERVGELFFKVVPSGSERSKKRAPITDTENLTLDPALTGAGTVAALSTGAALASNAAHADDELSDLVSDTELAELSEEDLEQADENLHPSDDAQMMSEGNDLGSEYDSDPDEIDTSKYDFSQSGQDGVQGGIEPVFGEGGILGQPTEQSLDPSFAEQNGQPHDFFAGVMSALNEEQQTDAGAAVDADAANGADVDADADSAAGATYDPYADPANYDEQGNYIGEYVADDQVAGAADGSMEGANTSMAGDAEQVAAGQDAYAANGAQYGVDGQMGDVAQVNAYGQQAYGDANADVPPMPIPGDESDAYAQQYDVAQEMATAESDDIMSADDLAQAVSEDHQNYDDAQTDAANNAAAHGRMARGIDNGEMDYSADAIANAAASEAVVAGEGVADTAASVAAPAAVAAAMAGLAGAAKAAMAAGTHTATAAAADVGAGSGSKGKAAKVAASAANASVAVAEEASAPAAEAEHEMTNEEREALNESLRKVVLADVTKVKSSGDPYAIAHDRLMGKDKTAEVAETKADDAKAEEQETVAAADANDEASVAKGDAGGADATTAASAEDVADKSEDSPYGYGTYAAKHGFDNANEPVSPAKAKALENAAGSSDESAEDEDADKGGVHTIVQRTDPKVFAAQLEAQKKAREEKERLEREKAEQEKLEAEKKAAQEAEAKAKAEEEAAVAEAEAEKKALDEALAAEKAKAGKDGDDSEGPHYVGTYADDMDKSSTQSKSKDEGPKYITPGVGGEEDDEEKDKEGPGTIIRDTRKEFEAQQAARAAAKAEQERLAKEAAAKEAAETAEKEAAEKAAAKQAAAATEAEANAAADSSKSESDKAEDSGASAKADDAESKEDQGISTVITRTVVQPKAAEPSVDTKANDGEASAATAGASASAGAAALGAGAAVAAGASEAQASELKDNSAQSDVFKALSSLASEIDSATADVKLSHAHDDVAKADDAVVAQESKSEAANDAAAANDADAEDDSFKPEHAYDFADGHKAGSVSVDVDAENKGDDEDDFSEFVSGTVNKAPNPQSGFNFTRFSEKKESHDHIFSEESSSDNESTQSESDNDSSSDDNIIAFDNVKSFEVGGLSNAFIPMPGEESAKVRHSLKDEGDENAAATAAAARTEAEAAAQAQAQAEAEAKAAAEQAAREAAREAAARAEAERGAAELAAAQEAAARAAAEHGHMHGDMPAFGEEQPMADHDFSRQTYSNHVNPADITRGFNFNQFDNDDGEEIEDSFGSKDSTDVFNHSGEDSLFGKFDIDDDDHDAFGSSDESSHDAYGNGSHGHRAGFGDDNGHATHGQSAAVGGSTASHSSQGAASRSDLNAFITDEDSDYEDDDKSNMYSSDDDYEDADEEDYDESDDDESVDQNNYAAQGTMQQNMQQMMPNNYQGMQNPMQQMQGMQPNMGTMPNQQMQYMQLPNGQYVPVMPNGMMYPNAQQGMMPNMQGMAPNAMGQMGVNPMGQYMQLPNGQFVPVMPNGMPVMPNGMNPMGMMQPNQMQPNQMQGNPMQQGMMYGNNMGMNPQVNAMQPNAQTEMQQDNFAAADKHESQQAEDLASAIRGDNQADDYGAGADSMQHGDANGMNHSAQSMNHDAHGMSHEGHEASAMGHGSDEHEVGVSGYQGTNMSEAGNAFMGAHNSSSSNLPSYMAGVAQAPAPASFEDTGSKAMCTVPRHNYDDWRPSLDLLARSGSKVEIPEEELEKTAERINEVLSSYGVKAQVADYLTGPVITRFDLELAPGVKSSAISSIETELCRNLLVPNVRVVPIIDGSSYVGLEVPNHDRQFITLADMASSREFAETKAVLPMCLGASVVGAPVVKDMAESPHLLVAGTTGSGKSAGLNTMLISMLLKRSPAELRLILVDPKQLEFSIYKDLPHLITPVITDVAEKTPIALNWCVDEMERRFKLMSLLGVRKLAEYNDLVREEAAKGRAIPDPLWTAEMGGHPTGLEPLPWIVVVVEEFADLMAQSGRKKDKEGTPEHLIARLSAKSRAAGIHLVLVTQTPRSEVVTGMIKANFPSRVAFTVQNRIDSTIVLDEKGAECLLGNGDMLYKFTGSSTATRAHGAFTSNDDVKAVVDAWREYAGAPEYLEDVIAVPEEPVEESSDEKPQKLDEKFDKAVELVRELGKAPTVSDLQSCLSIGYPRAKKLLRQLVLEGIID